MVTGIGGSGKTEFAKKIVCLVRSKGKLSLGCCSTGLQTHLYKEFDFQTAHSLFDITVVEDDDDPNVSPECKVFNKPEKKTMMDQVSAFIWDEALNNNRHCLELAEAAFYNFSRQLVICFGDEHQIPPVVKNGTVEAIIDAHLFSSPLFIKFKQFKFTRNLRLIGLHNNRNCKYFFSTKFLQFFQNFIIVTF